MEDRIQFSEDLKQRMKVFVLDLIKLCKTFPFDDDTRIFNKQLLRSGSSVYANCRASNRARSKAEFFSKMSIVVEEADETGMWLDLLIDTKISFSDETIRLDQESLELL